MKLHIDLPWGGRLVIEREPMGKDRFEAICILAEIFIVGSGFIKFFGMLV